MCPTLFSLALTTMMICVFKQNLTLMKLYGQRQIVPAPVQMALFAQGDIIGMKLVRKWFLEYETSEYIILRIWLIHGTFYPKHFKLLLSTFSIKHIELFVLKYYFTCNRLLCSTRKRNLFGRVHGEFNGPCYGMPLQMFSGAKYWVLFEWLPNTTV